MSIRYTENFKREPFWWDKTPRPDFSRSAVPACADVVIVGSGYTGLSAAMQTCKHGLHTVVLDEADAGWGCSSRNGGQISTSIKPSFLQLKRKYGAAAAMAILQEGNNALNWVEQVVKDNNLDCDFHRCGRFYAAHSARALQGLRTKIAATPAQLRHDAYIVEREDQHTEIGSNFYHGGMVHPHHASIDPAKYHQGLLQCAQNAGAEIISHCRANDIKKHPASHKKTSSFKISTARGDIQAKNVIIATSGYSGNLAPWQQRRIIPIGSYIIATEPLPSALIQPLIPNHRVITDTLDLVVYYRTCPERKRLLFGGRVSLKETDPRISAPRLRALMLKRFPTLKDARISHSWMGFVGYTFDHLPHIGNHQGIYYSMGYCGSGISLASYFGKKIGLKVAGDAEGETALDFIRFPGRPYYRGNPWFLAPSLFYYRWKDGRAGRSAG